MPDLDRCAEELKAAMDKATSHATNEIELRLLAEPIVRDLLKRLYGLDLSQMKSERQSGSGRYDTRYGGVVVEYEWKMRTPNRKRHAAKQALDYMSAERQQSKLIDTAVISAVVCDGTEWGFLLSDENLTGQLSFFAQIYDNPADRFVWYKNSIQACRRFLQLVGAHPKMPVTGAALVQAFGKESPLARRFVGLLLEAVRGRLPQDRTDTMYLEWRRCLDVAYGDLDHIDGTLVDLVRATFSLAISGTIGEYLFAIHTYFALVTRLIAIETIAISVGNESSRPSTWAAMTDEDLHRCLTLLETGEIPPGLGISNLFEGDVFSWYRDLIPVRIDMADSVRDACSTVSQFAFPHVAFGTAPGVDFLRDLYQGLSPRPLRKALGEFPTPHWLAQATLDIAKQHGADLSKDRILDPTCGTGSFLTPILVSRLQPLHKQQSEVTGPEIQRVLNTVAGIDINPIAVITTRMNFLMALGELASKGSLHLPVWLADSVLLPKPPKPQASLLTHILGHRYVELETSLDTPFPVPIEFISQQALARLTRVVRRNIRRESSPDEFLRDLDATLGPNSNNPAVQQPASWPNAVGVLNVLYQHLLELHRQGRDEVWAQIIENRFAPLFLEKFDLVVGNPPWLSWNNLPAQWRKKAEDIWRHYGLWDSPREPGAPARATLQTSDIAVLVAAVSLDKYLQDGGLLAFVMPKSVIQADPGNRAFRQYQLKSPYAQSELGSADVPFAPLVIHDFSDVQPFSPDATNSPIIMVVQRGSSAVFPIPGTRWFRSSSGSRILSDDWGVVQKLDLRHEKVMWSPVNPSFTPSPLAWWREGEKILHGVSMPYRFGTGFHTRGANGVYFLELRDSFVQNGIIRVANLPAEGKNRDIKNRGQIVFHAEADLVVPLVRGRDVKRYRGVPSTYLLLPYDPVDRSKRLDASELSRYPNVSQYLRRFQETLLARSPYLDFKPTENGWWHLQGVHHLTGRYLVCVTEIAAPPQCAVVTARWDDHLQRTVMPFVDHKITFFSTDDEALAYYLCAMINSQTLQRFLSRYASVTAISPQTLRQLPVPPFSSSNPMQTRIAELSKHAHRCADSDLPQYEQQIEDVVSFLLGQGVSVDVKNPSETLHNTSDGSPP